MTDQGDTPTLENGRVWLGKPFTPLSNLHKATARAKAVVYMIRSGEFLKIGIADDLRKRVETLALGNPHGLTVAAFRSVPKPMAKQLEQRLHAHFSERAVGREWFRGLDHREVLAVLTPLIRRAEVHHRSELQRWSEVDLGDLSDEQFAEEDPAAAAEIERAYANIMRTIRSAR